MKCPHCLVEIFEKMGTTPIYAAPGVGWIARHQVCPSCHEISIWLVQGSPDSNQNRKFAGITRGTVRQQFLAYPRGMSRNPCPPEVPKHIAEDYTEACLVLDDSPKSAAALARRCLQTVLREQAGIEQRSLAKQIEAVLTGGTLPSYLANSIDAVRNFGNFAAHQTEDRTTGEIIPVEVGKAEWTLDLLEELFDFYFVKPAALRKKQEALNQKLKKAGKPPMRNTTTGD